MQIRVVSRASELTDLIGSRICHDLISPLGAISNGVELLMMTQGQQSQEIDLISQSIESANARVRLFRLAFGGAEPGQHVGEAEVRTIIAELSARTKIEVNLRVAGNLRRQEVKLMLLLVMCVEASLPWGGRLDIANSEGDWKISGSAQRMQVDPDLWQRLSRPAKIEHLGAAQIQFALAPICAESIGKSLTVTRLPNEVTVRF